MKGQIIGLRKLSDQLDKMSDDLRSDLAKQMAVTMAQMNRDVKKGINTGSRTGRTYKRGGKTRQRSAPRELPKTDTGDLVSRFSTKVNVKPANVVGVLENNSDHAVHLEFASPDNGGRPFMRPLWGKWHNLVFIKFKTVIKLSLRKNSR
jgi:hypothetical protein